MSECGKLQDENNSRQGNESESVALQHSSEKIPDSSIYPSDEKELDHKLAEDLDKLLNENVSNISSQNVSRVENERENTLERSTLVLQDILARADTTFIIPDQETTEANKRRSSSITRLPSVSNDIIDMLIHIDNENYCKKDQQPLTVDQTSVNETFISSSTSAAIPNPTSTTTTTNLPLSADAGSDDTMDIVAELQGQCLFCEEDINPTTSFDHCSLATLLKLSEIYRKRVNSEGNQDDVIILININSVGYDWKRERESFFCKIECIAIKPSTNTPLLLFIYRLCPKRQQNPLLKGEIPRIVKSVFE